LLVGLARARCPSKFAYVRRAFYSNRRAPGDMRAKKASSVLASFRRGDTYDHIRRARSARMIYFLSESRTRAEPQDEYFLRRYLGSRRSRWIPGEVETRTYQRLWLAKFWQGEISSNRWEASGFHPILVRLFRTPTRRTINL